MFAHHTFSLVGMDTINKVNVILQEYGYQGYRLSLRQLFYQLVARGIIPNTVQAYKRLGDLVSKARLAGLVDWDMIEDRGRETVVPPMWESPAEVVDAAARQFAIDRWANQHSYVEVIVEKAALEGILIPVCRELGVRFTASRGYCSQSVMYEIGKRLERMSSDKGKDVHILYLGDHDPSGIDMTRDVAERLSLFSHSLVSVTRLALNAEQIEEWHPPENPAKQTDSRFGAYMAKFGTLSWELDAVDPTTLGNLVRGAVTELRDSARYSLAMAKEQRMRQELDDFVRRYRNKE
jgi:hypothetical protein